MNSIRSTQLPEIIQGGMGFKISGWPLARAVSKQGQLGTISGVALERVMALILQLGDPGGHFHKALSHFPFPGIAKKVLNVYELKNGISPKKTFRPIPTFVTKPSELLIALTICANFAFVWLAKEGHQHPVSINYLEKVAMPHVYAITGAMLANIDCITMGAGIPLQIPQVIQNLANGETATYRIPVAGKNITSCTMEFDPKKFFGEKFIPLQIPKFIPIISSNLLASIFINKLPVGSIQGFIVEKPSAGGHNAPPRNILFNLEGELIYGQKDIIDYQKISDFGLPFWIGGSCASPERLSWTQSQGATGIQAGSIFALCEESDMDKDLKKEIRRLAYLGKLPIKTDSRISPTGFPFKVAQLPNTIADEKIYQARIRICDQGGLVSLYETKKGNIGYRCSAEPIKQYLRKGGELEDTIGRACICNGLLSTSGLQTKKLYEAPIITLGNDLNFLVHLMTNETSTFSAKDIIDYLLGQT